MKNEKNKVDFFMIDEFLEIQKGVERKVFKFDKPTLKFLKKFINAYNQKIRIELKKWNYIIPIREELYFDLLDMLEDGIWTTLCTHVQDCLFDYSATEGTDAILEGDIYKLISCDQLKCRLSPR